MSRSYTSHSKTSIINQVNVHTGLSIGQSNIVISPIKDPSSQMTLTCLNLKTTTKNRIFTEHLYNESRHRNFFNKIFANKIQKCFWKIIHHDQVDFVFRHARIVQHIPIKECVTAHKQTQITKGLKITSSQELQKRKNSDRNNIPL